MTVLSHLAALCLVASPAEGGPPSGASVGDGTTAGAQRDPSPTRAAPPVGLEPVGLGLGGPGSGRRGGAAYSGAYSPGTLLQRAQASVRARLGDRDALTFSVSLDQLHFSDPVSLPGNAGSLPSELHGVGAEAGYVRRLDGGWSVGARLHVGSPSDEPFSSWSVVAYRAGVDMSFPAGGHGRWVLSLMSMNRSALVDHVPLPGAAYLYRSEKLNAAVGFPFTSVQWRPGRWTLSGLIGLRALEGEVAHGERRTFEGFARFSATGQPYLLANRPDSSNRLFVDERRLAGGLRFPLPLSLSAELQSGYVFERRVYRRSRPALVLSTPDTPSARLASGWFVSSSLRFDY